MSDKFTIRAVVVILGIVSIIVVVGGILLTLDGKTIPDAIIAIGSAAIGSVSTLLARTSTTDDPQPVAVVNPPENPVPVDAEP